MTKNKIKLGIILVAVLGVASGAYLYQSRSATKLDTTTQKHSTQTKEQAAAGSPNSTADTSQGSGKGSATTATSGGSLASPSGQLLNKQRVSLNSTEPATNPALESVCQTIANATCDIKLTSNGQVKNVGAKPTGGGTVIFDWDAKSLGLSAGSWSVQAVVSQNGQTGVSHTETLVVQP